MHTPAFAGQQGLPVGKLLLQCDGVLAEQWCPLDPEPPYRPPEKWDAPHVQHRFAEAIGTLLRLPLGRFWPDEIRGCWPAYAHEWDQFMARMSADMEQMAVEGSLSQEFLVAHQDWTADRHRVRERPSAQEISYMERALFWPGRYLRERPGDLVRALNLASLARARGVELDQVVRRGKHRGVRSSSTWQGLALEAAREIAIGLRVDRIAVF
jgi:hypothetical protein